MAVCLLKIAFWVLSTLSNLASLLIFSGVAHLLVLVMQLLRVPGECISLVLQLLKNFIEALFEFFWQLLMEAITSLVSAGFDSFKFAISGISDGISSAIGELGSQMKDAVDSVIYETLSEMAQTFLKDIWNNYMNAIGYVWDNA
uniref:Uncharacterized protein n=1 Tax=Nelumbo nucifera TaxID=4432 RepID=A0A822XUY9_NELNU|nr:TPA_asm: hypothetical protein HUJ06_025610 [Nelumbo nucifera]